MALVTRRGSTQGLQRALHQYLIKEEGRHFCTEAFHQCVPVLSTRLSFNKKLSK